MVNTKDDKYMLRIQGVSKSFPGVKALDNVSFDVCRGNIHAIVGENGAGKSTLIKILSGALLKDSGKVFYGGEECDVSTPLMAQQRGISVVHQELKLGENLSVAENIFAGHPFTKKILGMGRVVDWQKTYSEAQKLLDKVGFSLDPKVIVGKLSVAQKQVVEICKALSFNSELIIMDEPSATLTNNELETLFMLLERLKASGITIIYISHRLDEIFRIADMVTVMRDGKHIETMPVKDTDRQGLIALMVGRTLTNEYPKEEVPIGEVVFEAKNLSSKAVKDISFQLHKGEILGIGGLVGAGRTEVLRLIFGADQKTAGDMYVGGKKVEGKGILNAIRNGIGLVPEERKKSGLILGAQVRHNISSVALKSISPYRIINAHKEEEMAQRMIHELSIKTPDASRLVGNLSGGNQQKVVLAKWLVSNCDILMIDEPTRGVDVGAKTEIYKLITDMVKSGKSVIMVSSEMPEIIGMCDRVLVMHDGRITGELKRDELSQERILELATS